MLVLASGSPRRRELLGTLGCAFEVRPADVDETARPEGGPGRPGRAPRRAKAEAALEASPEPDVVVLAADTVVTLDGEVLGKPVDDGRRRAPCCALLSGRTHVVLDRPGRRPSVRAGTGGPRSAAEVALAPAVSLAVEVVATEVTFVDLLPADIAWYVATGEPADKAGGYGIQDRGAVLVSSIRGSHDNVVGLPLAVTRRLLAAVGLDPVLGSS